jgi:hypothetical protein
MKVLEKLQKENGTVYVTIKHDEQINAIVDVWDGFYGNVENFNRALKRVAELIEKHRCPYWLADLRNLQGPFNNSSAFIVNEVMPKAIKAGLKKEAVVMPANFFAELSTKQTTDKIGNLEIKIFGDIEAARNWLKGV